MHGGVGGIVKTSTPLSLRDAVAAESNAHQWRLSQMTLEQTVDCTLKEVVHAGRSYDEIEVVITVLRNCGHIKCQLTTLCVPLPVFSVHLTIVGTRALLTPVICYISVTVRSTETYSSFRHL